MMDYTAEDFRQALEPGYYMPPNHLIDTALRIAERVMTPGVIEDAAVVALRMRGTGKAELGVAIRQALIEEAQP